MFTLDELTSMQDAIENTALTQTCHILSLTPTSDGQGGFTNVVGTVSTFIPCRLDTRTVREVMAGGGINEFSQLVLTLPADTTIIRDDQIQLGSKRYNIIGSSNRNSSWIAALRLIVEEIE